MPPALVVGDCRVTALHPHYVRGTRLQVEIRSSYLTDDTADALGLCMICSVAGQYTEGTSTLLSISGKTLLMEMACMRFRTRYQHPQVSTPTSHRPQTILGAVKLGPVADSANSAVDCRFAALCTSSVWIFLYFLPGPGEEKDKWTSAWKLY